MIKKKIKNKSNNIKKLNNLNFKKVDIKNFHQLKFKKNTKKRIFI
jgi:1-deoxy-D-xylulose 5-phosphate reductoisomerase